MDVEGTRHRGHSRRNNHRGRRPVGDAEEVHALGPLNQAPRRGVIRRQRRQASWRQGQATLLAAFCGACVMNHIKPVNWYAVLVVLGSALAVFAWKGI